MVEIRIATTSEEKGAVYRARYEVYVEEMGWFHDRADHARRMLREPEDEHSWLLYAVDGDSVVGSYRMTHGADGFSPHQIELYGLAPFLAELPAEVLSVGERLAISPAWRGGDLTLPLFGGTAEIPGWERVLLGFGAGEPHLLSLYLQYQRPYMAQNISTPDVGLLIPMVGFTRGPEALIGLGNGPGLPDCIKAALQRDGTVSSPLLGDPATYWHELRRSLAAIADRPGWLFEGLSSDEIDRCVAKSHILRCAGGDRVIANAGRGRSVYLTLEGALDVSYCGERVGTLVAGDVFGETAFLLQRPRGFDVDVVTPTARIVLLSERHLRRLIDADPVVAAKVLGNVSKTVCNRLTDVETNAGARS